MFSYCEMMRESRTGALSCHPSGKVNFITPWPAFTIHQVSIRENYHKKPILSRQNSWKKFRNICRSIDVHNELRLVHQRRTAFIGRIGETRISMFCNSTISEAIKNLMSGEWEVPLPKLLLTFWNNHFLAKY